MRIECRNDKFNFIVGDVRDFENINNAMVVVDYVFHAGGLKQIPSCEFYPLEAIKKNIIDAENVLEASKHNGVKRVVVLSTDKAVYPINTMGLTKALMEKLTISKAREAIVKKIKLYFVQLGMEMLCVLVAQIFYYLSNKSKKGSLLQSRNQI